jgi:hypothetical protein
MNIYVVSRGSYSDYRVLCAAPDKATAEELCAALNSHTHNCYEQATVEELPLVRNVKELGPVTVYIAFIDARSGEIVDANPRTQYAYPWDSGMDTRYLAGTYKGHDMVRGASTRGYDEAIKAARDHLAEYKAQKGLIS